MGRGFVKHCIPTARILVMLSFVLFISAGVSDPVTNINWLKELESVEASTVLLNNQSGLVPIKDLSSGRIASVSMGSANASEFDSILNKYTEVSSFSINNYNDDSTLNKLNNDLKFYTTIIVQVRDIALSNVKARDFLSDLSHSRQLVMVLSGAVESLKNLDAFTSPVIWTSEDSPVAANFTAQVIFGGTEVNARLAEDISSKFKKGDGFSTTASRLKYTVPEEIGVDGYRLENSVSSIMAEAISQKATPGGVVMVVKDGKVIFNKAYGSHTYSNEKQDRVDDIFDLASITKISATTVAAMRLFEERKLNLDENLGLYFPLARSTSKSNLKLRELMLHEAGLTPFIPFYSSLKPGDYSTDSSALYSVKVADGYYIRNNYYQDVMLPRMLNTRLQNRGKYLYSDLSMYFLKEAIERQTAESLDQYVLDEFYKPLGMKTAGFNPRQRFDKSRIVPTENDTYFRKTLIEGFVHDQGAAMAGGVAGHAGLFASANDLAILLQMMLNGGLYGGQRYFEPGTIDMFTARQSSGSRRGLGFDRWDPKTGKYPSTLASPQTYGHTGFTGTCAWVDPKYNLIFIFLSNRVYEQTANKLSNLNIRPRIQDAVYQVILEAGKS